MNSDFEQEGLHYMVGRAPVLFDFLTSVPGLDFGPCWEGRTTDRDEGFEIQYLSLDALIEAKKLAGRPVDLQDLDEIRRAGRSGQA